MHSDTIALVTTAIRQRALCLHCIATNAMTDETDTDAALVKIGTAIQLRRDESERCQGCGEISIVVSISMDAPPS